MAKSDKIENNDQKVEKSSKKSAHSSYISCSGAAVYIFFCRRKVYSTGFVRNHFPRFLPDCDDARQAPR